MLCVHNLSSTDQDVIVYLPASEFHTPHRPAVELKGSVGDLPHHSIYDILTDLPSTVSQNGTPSPFAFKYVLIRLQELCIWNWNPTNISGSILERWASLETPLKSQFPPEGLYRAPYFLYN